MMDNKDWEGFKKKLKAKTEIDLDLYKEAQMKRRIGNLVTRAGLDSFVTYFDNVVKDKDEFAAFIEYLTINVSEFYRTPDNRLIQCTEDTEPSEREQLSATFADGVADIRHA